MDATSELTQAQAQQVVIRGVNREAKRGNDQLVALVRDAISLKDHNIRKLATVIEANDSDLEPEDRKLKVGFDSYLSYMSNAKGIAGMFDFELAKLEAWLAENPQIVGLSAAYKCLRETFTEPKAPKAKSDKGEADKNEGDAGSDIPLVDQILEALTHLSLEELQIVALAATEMSTPAVAA